MENTDLSFQEKLTTVLKIVKRQPRTTDTELAISLLNEAIGQIVNKPDLSASRPVAAVMEKAKEVEIEPGQAYDVEKYEIPKTRGYKKAPDYQLANDMGDDD